MTHPRDDISHIGFRLIAPATPTTTTLTINKKVTGSAPDVEPTFVFAVQCKTGTVSDPTPSITGAGQAMVTVAIDAECTVEETGVGGADTTNSGTDESNLTPDELEVTVTVSSAGATVFFENKFEVPPVDATIVFQKLICESYDDVRYNAGGAGTADDTEGNRPEFPARTLRGNVDGPVDAGNFPGCEAAAGWTFDAQFDQPSRSGPLQYAQGTVFTPELTTDDQGLLEVKLSELFDGDQTKVDRIVSGSDKLWISEQVQESADFGALQCHTDVLNDDNLESINGSAVGNGDVVTCIAWNVSEPAPIDYEIDVTKVVGGSTAPADGEYSICLIPAFDDSVDERFEIDLLLSSDHVDQGNEFESPSARRCLQLEAGESGTFDGLWPGTYLVYEVDPELDAGMTIGYSGDGSTVESEVGDAREVELSDDDPTASVTVTNTFPGGNVVVNTSSSADVLVNKAWFVNGDPVGAPADTDLSFTVDLGSSSQTVGDGETATFTGLRAGSSYDLSVTEDADSLPDPSVFAADGEVCEFVESTLDAPETVTAPDTISVTVSNAYTCDEVEVEDSVEELPEEELTEEEDVVEDEAVVEGVSEEAPTASPVAQRQAAEESAVVSGLPRTGASALLLTLMGLLSMGLGGALLRPRKRD